MATKKLTEKQKRFVEEYLVDLNATQAAARSGYSKKAARQQGSTLLSHPYIKAAIKKAQEKLAKKTGITTQSVLDKLAEAYNGAAGADQWGPAIKTIELQGKHLGMFADRTQLDVGPSLLDLILATQDKK